MEFYKLSAGGNDFILFDISSKENFLNTNLIKSLCQDRGGLGADGILVINRINKTSFGLKIYNKDGTEPNFCGNGLICIGTYLKYKKYKDNKITINLPDNTKTCIKIAIDNQDIPYMANILVKMPIILKEECPYLEWQPKEEIKHALSLTCENFYLIKVGVPHTVIFTDNLEKIDVNNLGRKIRNLQLFEGEDGTNVDFVYVDKDNNIWMRTYERGVESETLACGSGATSVAIVYSYIYHKPFPIKVHTKQTILNIHKIKDDIYLEGKGRLICKGKLFIPRDSNFVN
jgi:diaminopimelate epimerase